MNHFPSCIILSWIVYLQSDKGVESFYSLEFILKSVLRPLIDELEGVNSTDRNFKKVDFVVVIVGEAPADSSASLSWIALCSSATARFITSASVVSTRFYCPTVAKKIETDRSLYTDRFVFRFRKIFEKSLFFFNLKIFRYNWCDLNDRKK